MATLPPINTGALKVTFPANLPRNDKDLICMLLAGRLKDLWNGKLICAQLAIDDLIKDVTGVSGLESLRTGLVNVKSSLNDMRRASGYDKILGKVNSALGQVNQVFSLGGLCPSPVQAPRIPDILSALNQNLFGQANGILNALAQASNPKVCLGGGPKGFSLDWSKVTGDLALLKNTVKQFKSNPAGFSGVMNAFEQNLKNQSKRLNSEITRLEKNLTDPLGINDTKNTVGAIKRVKSISDDYKVKDRNGVEYKNPTRMMIPAEVDYVLDRADPIYTSPIKYVTVPVLDYCGDVVGYEKKIVSGDIGYAGWDPNNDSVNNNTPTENPLATSKQYDFTFIEENGTINVYDDNNKMVPTIELIRGKHYRFGLKLTTKKIKIYKEDRSIWFNGLTLTKEPDYGKGFEIVAVDTTSNLFGIEFDWAVSIENPVTPNRLYWAVSSNLLGTINISGITEIPESDKTYDISMAAKKAWMHLYKKTVSIPTGGSISHEERYIKRRYNMSANIISPSGSWSKSAMLTYNNGYTVLDDDETINDNGDIVVGNKISRWVLQLSITPIRYLIVKKYYNETAGMTINQVSCYIADSLLPDPNYFESLACLKYDEPIEVLNDITLPYTDFNEYKLALLTNGSLPTDGKLTNSDEFKIELVTEGDNKFFVINLTENRENSISNLPVNEFVYTSKIKFDPNDHIRNFVNSDPREERTYMYFKGDNGFKVECVIEYVDDLANQSTITMTPASSNVTEGNSLTFNVNGNDIANGTYYWTATNSKAVQPSSGSFTITNNLGSFSLTPTADLITEGSESTIVDIRSGSTSGPILQTSSSITINDTGTPGTPPFVVPPGSFFPSTATITVDKTHVLIGETTSITWTGTFDRPALDDFTLNFWRKSANNRPAWETGDGEFGQFKVKAGDLSFSYTTPVQKWQYPEYTWIWAGSSPQPPGGGHGPRIQMMYPPMVYVRNSTPILYNQQIKCSLVAGQYGIPPEFTAGTAVYNTYYDADNKPNYRYLGGCDWGIRGDSYWPDPTIFYDRDAPGVPPATIYQVWVVEDGGCALRNRSVPSQAKGGDLFTFDTVAECYDYLREERDKKNT
jgi:hypothetical protein